MRRLRGTGAVLADGSATVSTALELPGRFAAVVRRGRSYGASELLPVGVGQASLPVPALRSGAG